MTQARHCRKCETTEGILVPKKDCSHFYFHLCILCDREYFAFLTEQTMNWLEMEKEPTKKVYSEKNAKFIELEVLNCCFSCAHCYTRGIYPKGEYYCDLHGTKEDDFEIRPENSCPEYLSPKPRI